MLWARSFGRDHVLTRVQDVAYSTASVEDCRGCVEPLRVWVAASYFPCLGIEMLDRLIFLLGAQCVFGDDGMMAYSLTATIDPSSVVALVRRSLVLSINYRGICDQSVRTFYLSVRGDVSEV